MMSILERLAGAMLGIAAASASAAGQTPKLAFAPPARDIAVRTLAYAVDSGMRLSLDVFQRPKIREKARPALIFFNRAVGDERRSPVYVGWARAAASHDIAGIIADLREGREASDFRSVIRFLTTRGASLGIDTSAIAVYAASGNVATAWPLLEDPEAHAIKAAVIYYGAADIPHFRQDLPVLYVRAGLDRPEVNREIASIATRAVEQNAPLTLLNHPTGYHGFELFSDDEATRAVIDETLTFVRLATSRGYYAALASKSNEAAAAGAVQTNDYHRAATLYADLLRARPDDARLTLSYGESLLGDRQYSTACSVFATLRNKGLGPRDLGVPAARACALAGDSDSAMTWLRSIPSRFLPGSLATDSAFASMQQRPEFRALFSSPPG
jgi:dienelactone hydrolase